MSGNLKDRPAPKEERSQKSLWVAIAGLVISVFSFSMNDLMIGDVHFRVQNEARLSSKPKPARDDRLADRTVADTPDIPIPIRGRATVEGSVQLRGPVSPQNYEPEETSLNRQLPQSRLRRMDDVIPIDDSEEAQDVMLASDSY